MNSALRSLNGNSIGIYEKRMRNRRNRRKEVTGGQGKRFKEEELKKGTEG